MNKKILSIILSLAMLIPTFSLTASAEGEALVDSGLNVVSKRAEGYNTIFGNGTFGVVEEDDDKYISVNSNSAAYIRVRDSGGTNIDLYSKTNPLIVSFDMKKGTATSFYFAVDGGGKLTQLYDITAWGENEWHNITMVWYPDEDKPVMDDINKAKGYNIKTDLYVDGVYKQSENSDAQYAYAFSEIRFLTATGATYYLDNVNIKDVTKVEQPSISIIDGQGTAMSDNVMYGYSNKTVEEYEKTFEGAELYAGDTLADDSAVVTNSMVARAVNDYSEVYGIKLAKDYTLAAVDEPVKVKTWTVKAVRKAHTANTDANSSNLSSGAWTDGIVVSDTTKDFMGYYPVNDDGAVKIYGEKNPVVISMDINPWATNDNVTSASTENISEISFFSRDVGTALDDGNVEYRLSKGVTIDELNPNVSNNFTLVYYPYVSENGEYTQNGAYVARADFYLNGKFHSERYLTKYQDITQTDSRPCRLVIKKTSADVQTSCAITNMSISALNVFYDTVTSDKCTIENDKIHGWYKLDKNSLVAAIDGGTVTVNDEAVAAGTAVNVANTYSCLDSKVYSKDYTLGVEIGGVSSISINTDYPDLTLNAQTNIYIKDEARLQAMQSDSNVPKYAMIIAAYDENDVLLYTSIKENVALNDMSYTVNSIPENAAKVNGFLFDNLENICPVVPSISDDLSTYKKKQVFDVVCWGDSITEGNGGNGTTYPSELATLTGLTVRNEGIGGETSQSIAARMGALKIMPKGPISLGGNAGDTVTITGEQFVDETGSGIVPRAVRNGTGWYGNCYLNGIEGTITNLNVDTTVSPRTLIDLTFTRKNDGESLNVSTGDSVMFTPSGAFVTGDINVIFVGTNGWSDADGNGVKEDKDLLVIIDKTIANTSDPNKCIIIGRMSGDAWNGGTYKAIEDMMAEKYGNRFLNMREFLSNSDNLASVGITATAEDLELIAKGSLPKSLWANTDEANVDKVHLNATGYKLFAKGVYNKLVELNLIESK